MLIGQDEITGGGLGAASLTGPQKAAIVVRLLAGGEMPVTLQDLPEAMQVDLIRQIGSLGPIDPSVLDSVTEEFARLLERGSRDGRLDIGGALDLLDGSISPSVARRLRGDRSGSFGEVWAPVQAATPEQLLPVVSAQRDEVAAVILSKLDVAVAATLLGLLPGDRARRITYAVSQTANVRPSAVAQIGAALAPLLEDTGETGAFSDDPAERVGAILNLSRAATRDEMLAALAEADADFAAGVRRAIFTFANIPARLAPADVPKVTRKVDQADLVRALAAAQQMAPEAADFILGSLPQRMAESLRGDIEDLADRDPDAGEAAMTKVIAAIREMETDGEIYLIYDNA